MAGKRSGTGSTVVLVGRPNVGKSTLFNRIAGTRRAIVNAMPGTTRDVIAQPAEWLGTNFTLVDTGGLFGASLDPLHELVVLHGRRAIETADVIVFVVDGREGLVSGDEEIAKTLRPVGVPVILAVNKIDDKRAREEDFYQLGIQPVIGTAAEHGRGIGDLLDEILRHVKGKRGASTTADAAASAADAQAEADAATEAAEEARRSKGTTSAKSARSAKNAESAKNAKSAANATSASGAASKTSVAGAAGAKGERREKEEAGADAHAARTAKRAIGDTERHAAKAKDAKEKAAKNRERDAKTRDAAATGEIGVAIVGRPNVGKSSLVNRLLREERVMVSDLPGTTRDPIDTLLRWHGRDLRIVDTAGIRRAGKVAKAAQVEAISVVLARRAIARADVAVLLIDAVEGPTDQDAAIAGEAERVGCGVIIAANKWDLMKGRGDDFSKTFDDNLRRRLKFLDFAPVLHISAMTGERAPKLLEAIERVAQARLARVSTGALNRFVEKISAAHPPVSPGKREVRILYAAQTAVAPPTFVFFTNVATTFHFSYERFLTNQLRDTFGFVGTPIRLLVRRRGAAKQ